MNLNNIFSSLKMSRSITHTDTNVRVREAEIKSVSLDFSSPLERNTNNNIGEDIHWNMELKRLEEKLFMWKEVRRNTITKLREIADLVDSIGYKTRVAQVLGAGGGILASGLTMVGGALSILTLDVDDSMPILVAGAGIGLASGLTGGAATITNKILNSRHMSRVDVAIEVDSSATDELAREIRVAQDLLKVAKEAGTVLKVSSTVAYSTKGFIDIIRGVDPGQTLLRGVEHLGVFIGSNVNQEVGNLLIQASGSILAGTVTTVFGGLTMIWDIFQLKNIIHQLALGGEEGSHQIRSIASQLEEGLRQFFLKNENDLVWFNLHR